MAASVKEIVAQEFQKSHDMHTNADMPEASAEVDHVLNELLMNINVRIDQSSPNQAFMEFMNRIREAGDGEPLCVRDMNQRVNRLWASVNRPIPKLSDAMKELGIHMNHVRGVQAYEIEVDRMVAARNAINQLPIPSIGPNEAAEQVEAAKGHFVTCSKCGGYDPWCTCRSRTPVVPTEAAMREAGCYDGFDEE